eukprot:3710368-Rhodomonas_salina.2
MFQRLWSNPCLCLNTSALKRLVLCPGPPSKRRAAGSHGRLRSAVTRNRLGDIKRPSVLSLEEN